MEQCVAARAEHFSTIPAEKCLREQADPYGMGDMPQANGTAMTLVE